MLRNFVDYYWQMATEYRNKGFMLEKPRPTMTTGSPTRFGVSRNELDGG
jgi:hypothetical protein